MKNLFLIMIFTSNLLFASEVHCITIQENIKKIRCKYIGNPYDRAREVTFRWISPDNPADNRSKNHKIPAGHISVYDDRYFSGRSEGRWGVEVVDFNQQKVSTVYIKDSNAEVVRIIPDDPLLKKIR